jgi:hypothetical protein
VSLGLWANAALLGKRGNNMGSTGHQILIYIAIICELGATGVGFFGPEPAKYSLIALGLVFYLISLLVT